MFQRKTRLSIPVCILLTVSFVTANALLAQTETARLDGTRNSIVIKNAMVKISESVAVPVEQSGILTELDVKEGQTVTQGETIARVSDATLNLRLDRARLEHELAKMSAESQVDVEFSKKSFDVAQADMLRSERANERVPNSVPEAKIEKQRLERDRTELQLEQARRDLKIAAFKTNLTSSDIKLAQSELAKTQVNSPMTGLVVAVEKRVGEWVESSNVVCRIVRTDRLRVEGFVTADQASRISIGNPVHVRFNYDWLKQTEVAGKITFVSPEANPVNLNVQVWAEIPNPDAAIPAGLRGDILIDLEIR